MEHAEEFIWKAIESYFETIPQPLVRHHIESYNNFFHQGVSRILRDKNPLELSTVWLEDGHEDFKHKCLMYFGGKEGTKIYFGKPVIYDDGVARFMFPNEARLRNMTYALTIHYDVDIEFVDVIKVGDPEPEKLPPFLNDANAIAATKPDNDFIHEDVDKPIRQVLVAEDDPKVAKPGPTVEKTGGAPKKKGVSHETHIVTRTTTLSRLFLGKFPIMLQSDFCVLAPLTRQMRFELGECRNDQGGYFIVDGKEKTVICQEKFADNMLYIRNYDNVDADSEYIVSAEIRSVSENTSKPKRTLRLQLIRGNEKFTNQQIIVSIPNVRAPIPLFIVFRALGVLSDHGIIEMCLIDLEKYEFLIEYFRPSVHDCRGVMNQREALLYIASFTKYHTISYAQEVLADLFLPHVGEMNFIEKAYYLGYMTFRLLSVFTGLDAATDRDNYKFKRIELIGSLLNDLFTEYWTLQLKHIHKILEERMYFKKGDYEAHLDRLIHDYHREAWKERVLETGFKKAFKGNWGSKPHTKRVGVVQDLNRLSFNSMMSHLRKTNLELDTSVKLVGPRVLHSSQWGFIDPVDTPDGASIGVHKHLSIMTLISQGMSREPMIEWLIKYAGLIRITDLAPKFLANLTRIFVNGYWVGCVSSPIEIVDKIRNWRRLALIPYYVSASFDYSTNTCFVYTDAGRLCRPVMYLERGSLPAHLKEFGGSWTWSQWQFGRSGTNNGATIANEPAADLVASNRGLIDYIDNSESESALIVTNRRDIGQHKRFTHMELHESLLFGVMCNQIIYPENNPVTRNSFSCGQSKQAASVYHTNYLNRMDKTAIVLNYAQTPLVKSKYMEFFNQEENPYGENVMVAIMCYTGYNVEDAILVNQGAIQRGLFRTTYYSVYETREEVETKGEYTSETQFANVMDLGFVRPGQDATKLDEHGIIRVGTEMNDETVVIGSVHRVSSLIAGSATTSTGSCKTPKKGQLGIVDRVYISPDPIGSRLAKVRIREMRQPAIGDKMAGRAGQKGVVGLVIPEYDMPFSKNGLRPDIIINPHAFPSRQTIGQLVEMVVAKVMTIYGGCGDCTAFQSRDIHVGSFGALLSDTSLEHQHRFHSSGNEIMYNGMTGEQLESEIFVGPSYYMRLKHMVKDKINYRTGGPREAMTRQPVSGRANDGGLRIGEMERDGLLSHGATEMLRESFMERSDKYEIAICNTTGAMAIYNSSRHLLMSPMSDGPIEFNVVPGANEIMTVTQKTMIGRSFSLVQVPFTMKQFMLELGALGVQMRIVTEETLPQCRNLAFGSNTLQQLLQDDKIGFHVLRNPIPTKTLDAVALATVGAKPKSKIQIPLATSPVPVATSPMPVATSPVPMATSPEPGSIPLVPKYGTPNDSSPEMAPNSPAFDPAQLVDKNEPVAWIMDKNPLRKWRIKRIRGTLVTLETDDPAGLEKPSDAIQVVEQYQIKPWKEVESKFPNGVPTIATNSNGSQPAGVVTNIFIGDKNGHSAASPAATTTTNVIPSSTATAPTGNDSMFNNPQFIKGKGVTINKIE